MTRKTLHICSIIGCFMLLACSVACKKVDFDTSQGLTLTLQVTTGDRLPATRSVGEEDLGENLLQRLDYYFFKLNGTNSPVGNCVLHVQETGLRDQIEHRFTRSVTLDELNTLFGTGFADGALCYVYVVANLPEGTAIAEDATLTLIQDTVFSTDLSGAQSSFVMAGYSQMRVTIEGTNHTVTTTSGGSIPVTRAASKIDLMVTEIQQYVEDKEGEEVKNRWESVPDEMIVMFYNGVKTSYVYSASNHHYTPNAGDYFSLRGESGRRSMKPDNNGVYGHEIPFYSYYSDWRSDPDHACYLILGLPWKQTVSNGVEVENPSWRMTYYQIPVSQNDIIYENRYYQISVKIGMLGSFELPEPVELTDNSYIVVDWGTLEMDASIREAKYLIVEEKTHTLSNEESGSILYSSSHPIRYAYVTQVKYLALQTFDEKTITNSNDKDGSVDITSYSVNGTAVPRTFNVNTDGGKITLTHEINSSMFTKFEIAVYIENTAGLSETVTFIQYPAIYANNEAGGDVFINGFFGHVKRPDGQNTFYNWPSQGNSPSNLYSTSGIAFPALPYYRSSNTLRRNGNTWVGSDDGTRDGARAVTSGFGGVYVTELTNKENKTITRITISSFNENDVNFTIGNETNHSFKIGDPRVASGWTSEFMNQGIYNTSDQGVPSSVTLPGYLVTSNTQFNRNTTAEEISFGDWGEHVEYIKKGTDDSDIIAPDILIASYWGRPKGGRPSGFDFDTAQKRCASYQEAGYPAGRWRLPTEAEIAFFIRMQSLGVIETLFTQNGTRYRSSSGRQLYYSNGTWAINRDLGFATNNSVRCVYDIWYWGEEKVNTYEYQVKPTK